MKFTVEVEDFYMEGDNLQSELAAHIRNSVVYQISQSIKDRVDKQIAMEVKGTVENTMYKQISLFISEFIKEGKMKSQKGGNEMVSIHDWVLYEFERNNSYSTIKDHVNNLGKYYADEMKKRYDLLFASQLVAKMKDVGLIDEKVANKLIEQ